MALEGQARVEEKDLIAHVEEKWREGQNARQPFERDAYLNTAFVVSRQWADYDDSLRVLSVPQGVIGRIRITSNHMIVIYRKLISRFVGMRPIINVMPNDDTDKAKDGAVCGTKMLKSFWYSAKMLSKMIEIASRMILTGSAWVKVYYDTNKGPKSDIPLLDPSTQEPVVDPMTGQPVMQQVPAGEIDCDVLGLMDIVFDASAKKLEDCQWFICSYTRNIDRVRRDYPGVTEDLKPERGVYSSGVDYMLNQTLGKKQDEMKDAVVVKEYWERPCKDFPKGRKITWAGGTLLDFQQELPYVDENGQGVVFPIVQFDFIKIPDRFVGFTLLDSLRVLQRAYNQRRSQIAENAHRIGNPKLLMPVEARVKDKSFDDRISEKVPYMGTSGMKPEWISPSPLPEFVYQDAATLKQEMYEISGVMDLSNVAPGSKTGIGLAYVQEDLESQHAHVIQGMEEVLEELGSMILKIAAKEYVVQRTLRIPGKTTEVMSFTGAMLEGQFTISARMGSGLPQNRIARQQYAMSLWQSGLLRDPKEALQIMDQDESAELLRDFRIDESQAARENEEMTKGIIHVVEDFHNHAVHIQSHNNYRKSDGYDKLSDEIKQQFAIHIASHEQFLLKQLMGMQSLGMAPPGMGEGEAPPGPDGNQPLDGQGQRGQQGAQLAETRSGIFPGSEGSTGGPF